jgi:TRAP-type C4-dicarboxylate transport system substrate-binding protein
MIFSVIWASRSWLESLPPDLRKIVLDVGREMDQFATDNAKKYEATVQKTWTDAGVTISDVPPDQKAALFAKVRPIGQRVLGQNSKTAKAWEALQAAAAEVK